MAYYLTPLKNFLTWPLDSLKVLVDTAEPKEEGVKVDASDVSYGLYPVNYIAVAYESPLDKVIERFECWHSSCRTACVSSKMENTYVLNNTDLKFHAYTMEVMAANCTDALYFPVTKWAMTFSKFIDLKEF